MVRRVSDEKRSEDEVDDKDAPAKAEEGEDLDASRTERVFQIHHAVPAAPDETKFDFPCRVRRADDAWELRDDCSSQGGGVQELTAI